MSVSTVRTLEPRNSDVKAAARKELAADLQNVLLGTYKLLLASQLVHWNVRGPLFFSVHKLTEEHYEALFKTLDVVAERIRALGAMVPVGGATRELEVSAKLPGASMVEMVEELIRQHEAAAADARATALRAEEADDIVTTDMLVEQIEFHEKAIWMLRAIIIDTADVQR